MKRANPVFVALDVPSRRKALAIAEAVKPYVGGVKLGLEYVSAKGPAGVKTIVDTGVPVFLDVKLHDIPNTVAGAMRALGGLGAAIINVHASGGPAMMKAAVDAVAAMPHPPKLIGVTVLTSLSAADLIAVGITAAPLDQVIRLAVSAKHSGLDGVVCSPQEIAPVRAACGPDFLIVTPGIRPAGTALNDQKRVMTPAEALAAGADILVIGRPITDAPDPAEAARTIAAGLGF